MIGSDVVIAGMVGDKCFAYSYYLTAKEQCNYEGGQVWPPLKCTCTAWVSH